MTNRQSETVSHSNGSTTSLERKRERAEFGKRGEALVVRLLKEMNWKIRHLNWRAGRWAEIDIVATDPNGELVFCEVKTRCTSANRPDTAQAGIESIHGLKQRKIVTAAHLYLTQHRLHHARCRFDVVIVHYPKTDGCGPPTDQPNVLHIKNAFHGFGW